MGPLQWGDVPTWIGGAGALVAAWYAYQTITSQRQQIGEQQEFIGEQSATLELQRAELRAAALDRKWAQARQVHMSASAEGSELDEYGDPLRDDHWQVTIHNGSVAPLHEVEVRFGSSYLAAESHRLSVGGARGGRWTVPVHLLGPGRSALFLSPRWQEVMVHNNRPVLFFTDDSGVRWSLDLDGKLDEEPTNSAP